MSGLEPARAAPPDPYDAFRAAARRLLVAGVAPDEAAFDAGGQPPLFGTVAAEAFWQKAGKNARA